MHFVYVLLCNDGTYYFGLTQNIKKRFSEHNEGLVHYTKSRLPCKLQWIGVFKNKHNAAKFEQYLKTGSGNAFCKKRLI